MKENMMNPAAGERAGGARDATRRAAHSEITTARTQQASLTVMMDGNIFKVRGRLAQTLALLIDLGSRGVTSGEASPLGWARRTSAYVAKLRAMGFPILTVWETIGDARVGRYVLGAAVAVLARRVT